MGSFKVKLLLDTHVWLWYLLGSKQLTPSHRKLIDSADNELWLSPISLWEASILIEKGRVPLNESGDKWIERALSNLDLREAALTFEIARRARKLSGLHEDPADRFIAATAAVLDLTLLTSDKKLLKGVEYASL